MNPSLKLPSCDVCTFKTAMFNSIPDDRLGLMSSCKEQKIFKKGELICMEGAPIDSIIYMHKGLVKLHKRISESQSQIISIAKAFDFIGLISVFSRTEYRYSITAIEDSSVCYISKECMLKEIEENGAFALDIIQRMSKVTDDILESTFALHRKNLRGRIAHILLDFSENIYKKPVFELPVARREIAELIDMRTENVIRIFSEFRKDKIIRINGHEIEILNIDMLHRISNSG